jgi:SM-20-related protein
MQNIVEQLNHTGFIVLENVLNNQLTEQLLARCQDDDSTRFQAARIGRGQHKTQNPAIRGDVISWFNETDSTDQAYLAWMEALRKTLNAALFLGLFDYECHYAIYNSGAGYAKHSDVLAGKKNRILSTVLYLNKSWHACDGGELILFEPDGIGILARITPTFGTMIIFLSESFPHEVLLSRNTRRSVAGWFRASGH